VQMSPYAKGEAVGSCRTPGPRLREPILQETSPSETDPEVRFPGRHATYMMKQESGTSRETAEVTSEDLDHNPYLLILGCPRSVTTLLQRIVDAHPAIAVVFETHWIPRRSEKRRGDYNLEYLRESYDLATDHMRRIYNSLDQLHELKPGRHEKRV
jgi:hypothetical protein